jgi:GNAT superfamily N-acetyltransferase
LKKKKYIFIEIMTVDILIRTAGPEDVPALTGLSEQLGYPVTEQEILDNLQIILSSNNETVLVAVAGNKVAGWIGLVHTIHLCAGHYCQVSGLVVDTAFHRQGIGKKLVAAAKQWALDKKLGLLRVNCNTKRKEAHAFYSGLGFTEIKEQKNFGLTL